MVGVGRLHVGLCMELRVIDGLLCGGVRRNIRGRVRRGIGCRLLRGMHTRSAVLGPMRGVTIALRPRLRLFGPEPWLCITVVRLHRLPTQLRGIHALSGLEILRHIRLFTS